MDQLTVQIIQKALQQPNPGRGADFIVGLVCRWAALVDLEPALFYLKDSMEKARQVKSGMSKHVEPWEQSQYWSELKKRQKLMIWMISVVLEKDSPAMNAELSSIEDFAEFTINNDISLTSELDFAKQLTTLSPYEVESIMNKAAIEWALSLDIEALKADSRSNGYNYPDGSQLSGYPYALIYFCAEVAFQSTLTQGILEHLRS